MTDFNTIKKMIHQMSFILTKKQKYQMIGMFIVISIGACFELLGVTMLLPFVQSILAPDELLNNFFIRTMLGNVISMQEIRPMSILLTLSITARLSRRFHASPPNWALISKPPVKVRGNCFVFPTRRKAALL